MRNKTTNWPKNLLQWGSLAALIVFLSGLAAKVFTKMPAPDPEAYCPMGGLQAFVTYLVRGSLPCSMSSLQILMGLALAAAVILFSKLFCAYLCPVGTIEDLLIRLRKKLKLISFRPRRGDVADTLLRLVKYGLLFWIFYMTATASELFCKNLDPYYAVATGFKGEITLELYNANRCAIELRAGRRVGQLVFAKMDSPAINPYSGKYQGQTGATGSRVFLDSDK